MDSWTSTVGRGALDQPSLCSRSSAEELRCSKPLVAGSNPAESSMLHWCSGRRRTLKTSQVSVRVGYEALIVGVRRIINKAAGIPSGVLVFSYPQSMPD